MESEIGRGSVHDTVTATQRRIANFGSTVKRHEWVLWGLVLLGLVGDVALTYYGITSGIPEGNPIVAASIEQFGNLGGILVTKAVAMGVALAAWAYLSERYRAVVPVALAPPWLLAAAINVFVIWG